MCRCQGLRLPLCPGPRFILVPLSSPACVYLVTGWNFSSCSQLRLGNRQLVVAEGTTGAAKAAQQAGRIFTCWPSIWASRSCVSVLLNPLLSLVPFSSQARLLLSVPSLLLFPSPISTFAPFLASLPLPSFLSPSHPHLGTC